MTHHRPVHNDLTETIKTIYNLYSVKNEADERISDYCQKIKKEVKKHGRQAYQGKGSGALEGD